MKKTITATLLAATLTTQLSADFLGAEVGYAGWYPSVSGTVQDQGRGSSINFEDDLGFDGGEFNGFAWAYFDHFIPLIPNVKVQQTNYSSSSTKIINTDVRFNIHDYSGTKTTTDLQLNQLDLIAYWRILDNWVNLDLGIMVKQLDGYVTLTNSVQSDSADLSSTIPMAYVKARFDLPFTGLSVEADFARFSYDGSNVTDMKGGVVYQSSIGLGATVGMKHQSFKLGDTTLINSEADIDVDIDGVYAGLFFHF